MRGIGKHRLWVVLAGLAVIALIGAACTREVEGPTKIVEKEVIKEVPVQVIVEKEVIKEVPIEKVVIVEKVVIKEVPVQVVVEKEVIKEVPVEVQVIVEKEVVRTVEVPVVIEVEVVKTVEVIKEVVVEVEAKREKVVNIAKGSPGTLMPHNARSSTMLWVYHLAFSYLIAPDPTTNTWIPDLAERWERTPDGKSWTFFLRKNALWSDGMPVTAKDIAFTIQSYLTPDTVSRFLSHLEGIEGALDYIAGKRTDVPGIVIVDDHTITFNLNDGDAFFPLRLTGVAGHSSVPILPEHLLGNVPPKEMMTSDYFKLPVTSGAFTIKNYIPNEVIEYEANDNYYFGRPKIDRIFQRSIRSKDAIQIGLQRGELDLAITSFSPEVLQTFINDPRMTIIGGQGNTISAYIFNYRRPRFTDGRIHQAFIMALDRQALIDTFHAGNGTIRNVGMTHAWYAKPEWDKMYPYDPVAARQLLVDVGWDFDKEVEWLIGILDTPEARARLAAMQQYLEVAGFKIKFKSLDSAAQEAEFLAGNWDLTGGGGGLGADPDGWVTNRYSLLGTNRINYANDEFEKLILAGRRAFTMEERAKIYVDMTENHLLIDLPNMGMWTANRQYVKSNRFVMPLWEGLPKVTNLSTVPIISTFIGKDWWDYQIERWDVDELR